jgi:esterase/lipase
MKDHEVPWTTAQRIAEHVNQDDVRVTLIKNGDHHLSSPQDLTLLWWTIQEFIRP